MTARMIGYLVAATHVASRTPIYLGIAECSACPGFQHSSRDVTSCGSAFVRHYVQEHAGRTR